VIGLVRPSGRSYTFLMSKVWLVTGSSRGLGRDLAKAVLAAGDRLVATARDPEQLRDIVAAAPDRAIAVKLDVTRADDAREAVKAAVAKFGRIDVLVNNAGYANVSSIEDVAEDDFRTQMETNFFGVFHVTRAALPVLREQKSGHVIQIASIGGRMGSAGLGAYQSAKWAVEGFSEVLDKEVRPLGIKVTVVEPGGFRTDWAGSSMRIDELTPAYRETVGAFSEYRRQHDGQQQGDPAKGAKAILELANLPAPPLHLLLGTDALFLAGQITAGRAAEDDRWKALSASTDFAGTVPFEETDTAKYILAQRRS
jgi:NAD(P)-dependent dehydrogenase (short-subunit alcohol dehydrogenase family)